MVRQATGDPISGFASVRVFGQALKEAFYSSNSFPSVYVADPFMGGGTPILEANRIGCNVTGFDINPMSWWIVKQEIEHLDLNMYIEAADSLRLVLEKKIGHLYRTRCLMCGSEDAHVKYFLWVKTKKCRSCGEDIDLFPGYLLAADSRHPKNVFVCSACGELTETGDRKDPGRCGHCLWIWFLTDRQSEATADALRAQPITCFLLPSSDRRAIVSLPSNTTAPLASLLILEGSSRGPILRTLNDLPKQK
jgi:hypothetical protein